VSLRKGCASLWLMVVKAVPSGETDTGSRLRLCDVGSAFPRGRLRAEWKTFGAKMKLSFMYLG
jgi:hypothetical protein